MIWDCAEPSYRPEVRKEGTEGGPAGYRERILLSSDLDGTLFFRQGDYYGPRRPDTDALVRFTGTGNILVLNSGRPYISVLGAVPESIPWDYVISDSGARITARDGRTLMHRTIPAELVDEAVSGFDSGEPFTFGCDSAVYCIRPAEGWMSHAGTRRISASVAEIPEPVTSFAFHTESAEEVGRFAAYMEEFRGRGLRAFVNGLNVDVTSDVSKGEALLLLAKELGIGRDRVWACGDAANDLPMLTAAGHAVSFVHAEREAKECAEFIVASVEELVDRCLSGFYERKV